MKKYLFLATIVVILWALSWVGLPAIIPNLQDRGLFGDQFGAVNALFSGLAFAVIVSTLFVQHQELQNQRKQFEQQVLLAALTEYGNITKALWEHDERQKAAPPSSGIGSKSVDWTKAANARYKQLTTVLSEFEKRLREGGYLKEE